MSAIVPMTIDGVRVAVSADRVVEVVSERGWTPLPGSLAEAPGVVTWRQRAIAAIDIGVLLGREPRLRRGATRKRLAVVKVGACTAALPVDTVQDVEDASGEGPEGSTMLDDALDALARDLEA